MSRKINWNVFEHQNLLKYLDLSSSPHKFDPYYLHCAGPWLLVFLVNSSSHLETELADRCWIQWRSIIVQLAPAICKFWTQKVEVKRSLLNLEYWQSDEAPHIWARYLGMLIPVVGFEILQWKVDVHGTLTFRTTGAVTWLIENFIISLVGDVFTMTQK